MLHQIFHWLQKNPFFFAVAIFAVIIIGGIVEIIPSFAENTRPVKGLKPYSVLQLTGRQIYIREGCNTCHSQLIRPFKAETDRYGRYSVSGEYAYDRPFLWGSKRTGPDLLRVGNYRNTVWHEFHLEKSTSTSPGSAMPNFPWLFENKANLDTAYAEAVTVKEYFGVPYDQPGMPTTGSLEEAHAQAQEDARPIVEEMRSALVKEALAQGEVKEIVALIAYLNGLK